MKYIVLKDPKYWSAGVSDEIIAPTCHTGRKKWQQVIADMLRSTVNNYPQL